VIIDSRDPVEPPLRDILDAVWSHHEVVIAPSGPEALETIARAQPRALLVHAGLDPRPDKPAAGPLVASLALRRDPALSALLYTGSLTARHERTCAQLGVQAPLVFDQRLALHVDEILGDLFEHAAAVAELSRSTELLAGAGEGGIDPDFRVERFLSQVEHGLLLAALREHATRTHAAGATEMSVETFGQRLQQHGLELRRPPRPRSHGDPTVLWCSSSAVPPSVADTCESLGASVRAVTPGSLDPAALSSVRCAGAVVDVLDPAAALDAWLLLRSVRPHVLTGSPPAPVRVLLAELGVTMRVSRLDGAIAPLVRAGCSAARLYADEQSTLRLAYAPGGLAVWPMDVAGLLGRVDAQILLLAQRTTRTLAEAARAVGLPETTFRSRLKRAGRNP
jgi:hypothetical protein